MSSWWKRFKPNQSTLPAALIATVFCGVSLLILWTPPQSPSQDIDRYGNALVRTLAHANAGLLLNQDRIALALVASQVAAFDEVAGVVFYSASNDIIALSGSTDPETHFIGTAALDDTMTGHVTLSINEAAFAPPPRPLAWLASILVLIVTPFLSLGILQLSARGNRSLPIVSVPEPRPPERQQSFCLTVNLHNQLSLSRSQREQAIADALMMAQEVSAIHHGFALPARGKGVMLLFDRNAVNAGQAVCAAFLLMTLLDEFETEGSFRCFLSELACPGAPGELTELSLTDIAEDAEVDQLMTLAALAKPQALLTDDAVYGDFTAEEQSWAGAFDHPLLDDMEAPVATYSVEALPDQQAQLVVNQARVILGFNQASA